MGVRPERKARIEPTVISHAHGDFNMMFCEQGTLDHTNTIVTPAALDSYHALGGRAAIASYVEPLVEWAADMLAEALGTFRMDVPKTMEAPFMRLVALPHMPAVLPLTWRRANQLTVKIMLEYKVDVQCTCHSGRFWVRLSGAVFNTKEDYLAVRDALLKMLEKMGIKNCASVG